MCSFGGVGDTEHCKCNGLIVFLNMLKAPNDIIVCFYSVRWCGKMLEATGKLEAE